VLAIRERNCLGPAVHAELGEYVLDVGPDRVRADDEARRDLALIASLREHLQDLDLPGRQARATGDPRPVEEQADPRQQLVKSERLDKVFVGTYQEAGHAVIRLGPLTGDENDGEPGPELVPQLVANLVSREARKDDLDYDELRWHAPSRGQSLLAVVERGYPISGSLEKPDKATAEVAVGVDDEHMVEHLAPFDMTAPLTC